MSRNEVKIESVKTPQGSVPTVKGLETALNAVIDQIKPLAETFQSIEESLSHMEDSMGNVNSLIQQINDNLAEFLVLMSKINAGIADWHNREQGDKDQLVKDREGNLLDLQGILVSLLSELQGAIASLSPKIESK